MASSGPGLYFFSMSTIGFHSLYYHVLQWKFLLVSELPVIPVVGRGCVGLESIYDSC